MNKVLLKDSNTHISDEHLNHAGGNQTVRSESFILALDFKTVNAKVTSNSAAYRRHLSLLRTEFFENAFQNGEIRKRRLSVLMWREKFCKHSFSKATRSY